MQYVSLEELTVSQTTQKYYYLAQSTLLDLGPLDQVFQGPSSIGRISLITTVEYAAAYET
jgi:hypothetical protein